MIVADSWLSAVPAVGSTGPHRCSSHNPINPTSKGNLLITMAKESYLCAYCSYQKRKLPVCILQFSEKKVIVVHFSGFRKRKKL